MKNLMIAATVAMAGLCAIAEANVTTTEGKTARRKPLSGAEFRMKTTGGWVKKPDSAIGKVVFLNAQKKVPAASLNKAFAEIEGRLHPEYEVREATIADANGVLAAVRDAKAQLGVAIVDFGDATPALLAAPEEGWALVNVAKLAADASDAEALASRTRKEVLRAFALVGGGAFMCLDPIVMRADVRKGKDLDAIPSETYGIDICRTLAKNLPAVGVTPWRVVTYRLACQEGWAPQPTNDYQKAIWDKVHQLPTNPIPLKKPTK